MVNRESVAVGIGEERLKADAGVEGLAAEFDPARLEGRLGGLEVLDVELDRQRVWLELEAEGVGLHDRQGQVPGLELDAGHLSPALADRQLEDLGVELLGGGDVACAEGDEVGS